MRRPALRPAFALLASLAAAAAAHGQTLTDACTVSVLNRTAPVSASGVWVLPNVPTWSGPVRVRATCVENGVVAGRIAFRGETITGRRPHEIVRRGLVLVPERDKVFETLTVQENLAALVPGGRRLVAREQIFEYFPVLADRRRQLAGYLSGGERQMLALATALLCQPAMLLVDELSLGLAPMVVEGLMRLVARLRDELGLAVLLVEQNAAAALGIADTGYVIEHGRIVYEDSAPRLLAHEDIREFYLGVGHRTDRRRYTDVKQYRRRRRWF